MRRLPRRPLAAIAALLTVAVIASGCNGMFGGDDYRLEAEFARTFNLFPGSPVTILGVTVGKITHIDVPEGDDRVTVTMVINGAHRVPTDARAIVLTESLLGERYVQLDPPLTDGGEALADGDTIPLERTDVPAEFDEVLEGLNDFVGGLDETEVGRAVTNLATTLDGQGDDLGRVIDQAHEAVGVLRNNDEDLVSLASRLADLNQTLATRDRQIGELIENWNTLTGSLVDDRDEIDAALSGLVRLSTSLEDVLRTHRGTLRQDLETLAQVGRTANRNLDHISLSILSSAELFRNASRIIDVDRNLLPLLNQTPQLVASIQQAVAGTLTRRLVRFCRDSGLPADTCDIEDIVGGEVCLPPLLPCSEDRETPSFTQAVARVVQERPEIGQAMLDDRAAGDRGTLDDAIDPIEQLLDPPTGSLLDGDEGGLLP